MKKSTIIGVLSSIIGVSIGYFIYKGSKETSKETTNTKSSKEKDNKFENDKILSYMKANESNHDINDYNYGVNTTVINNILDRLDALTSAMNMTAPYINEDILFSESRFTEIFDIEEIICGDLAVKCRIKDEIDERYYILYFDKKKYNISEEYLLNNTFEISGSFVLVDGKFLGVRVLDIQKTVEDIEPII